MQKMIKIYASDAEACLVGIHTGNLEEATKYIESLAIKHGFLEPETTKKNNGNVWIKLWTRANPLNFHSPQWKKIKDLAEELMDFGDVRGDYPSLYVLEEVEIRPGYNKVGSFFS
jgi:hypothetical protein